MKKHYPGTDEKAFGSGGIIDCDAYLAARLGGGVRFLSETVLPVPMEDNCLLSGRPPVENCSVAAIVRVYLYWDRKAAGGAAAAGICPAPPAHPHDIYGQAEQKAAAAYGYTDKRGLAFWRIDDLAADLFSELGRPANCRSLYRWSFQRDIAPAVKAGFPVILNLAAGYYFNHTVTVAGYRLYEKEGRIFPMLCLADGWQNGPRYLHLDAFLRELGFGLASLSTIEPLS